MKRSDSEKIFLGQQLQQVIAHQLGKVHWDFFMLSRCWADIVGSHAATHTLPAWVRKGVLWIYVDSSVWVQELNFMKPQVLQQANNRLGETTLKDLRCLQQVLDRRPATERVLSTPDHPVDQVQQEEFMQLTKTIADTGCQEALFGLWLTFQKKQRGR